ncbi:MAG TPA: Ig-like domain-containing protein [Verrucomicrobiae bacterium]
MGFSQAATLEWDRNPEINVIGYRVYVGRVSRLYDSVLDIGNQTSAPVPTSPGKTYFAVTAYDSDGLESDYSEEIFYTLPGVNTAPSALSDNYVAAKNTTLNVSAALGLLVNDWDADGDALMTVLANGAGHGTVTLNADGSFSYSPTIGFVGADSFTYQASDGIDVSEVTTVNVTVNEIPNRPPNSQPDNYTTPRNTPLNVSALAGVLANDTDLDGDVFIADLQVSPLHGTVNLSVDGSFLYTPAVGYTGVDSFTYIAFDGIALSPAALATITVTGFNTAPTAQPDSYVTVKNTALNVAAPLGVLANDTDIDSDPLTAVLMNSPGHGSVTLNANGSFVYTPNANYTGTDTFRYRANDGAANSATVTVTITINPPPNSVPVAVSDTYSMAKNTTLSVTAAGGVLANDTDADNASLTALLFVSPTHGTLTLNANGSFNYTPTAGYNGTDSFGYRARDSVTNSATATVTITIMNNVPVARVNSYTVTKNTALNVTTASGVLANDTDADGDVLTAVLVSLPANGTLSFNANGSFLYTPASGYNGSDSFVYRASDGSAASNAIVTITINNTSPTALGDSYSAAKNSSLTIAAAAGVLMNDADANGDSLTAALVTAPTHGIVALNANGSFVYTPAANYTGNDSFVYRASDGSATANATVTLTIANSAPVAQVDSYVTSMNTALSAAAPGVLANDTDANSDSLTATLISSPAHGSLTLNGNGSFLYTPATGFTGTDTFGYRANDGSAVSATAVVTLTVNAVPRTNSPPTPEPDAYFTTRNTPLNVPASSGVLMNDTDVDGNPLNATLLTSPAHGTVTLSPSGGFSYTPAAGFVGADTFQYLATDGAASASATVSITVNEEWANSPPAAQPDEFATSENTPLNVSWASRLLANDIDVDGDTLTAVQMSSPSHGNVTLNSNGTLVYTPAAGFYGVDHFDYTAFDGTDHSGPTRVTITVTEQPDSTNSPPNAEPESYYTSKNAQLNMPATSGVLLNDSDAEGDPLTATLLISTTYGTLVLNPNGGFVYTPNANFTGTDSFVYQASDGTSGSPTRRVTITVLAGLFDTTACTTCFAGLDEVLASRSNAFTAVIAARRSVPTNATCPQYHVLVFQTLSRSLVLFHDPAADHALSLAADCVVSELQDEVNARLTYTATLAPSKFTTQASNYLNVARQNLGSVHGAADNVARAKYFTAVVSALLRVEKAIASGDLAPASLAGKSLECLLTDGGRPFQSALSFTNDSFVFVDAAGTPLGSGTYSFTRTAYNEASLNLHFDTYAPGESTSFAMKFSRTRNRMTGSKMRGYFTVQ